MREPLKPSHEVLRAAVDKAGVKAVSARLGLSQAMVYKWCVPTDGSGTPNPLDRVAGLVEASKDEGPVVWLCEQADGAFVRNPAPKAGAAPVQVLLETQKLVREFSDLLDEIAKSMSDGKVDAAEARRIRSEWEALKRLTEGFVRSCESPKGTGG